MNTNVASRHNITEISRPLMYFYREGYYYSKTVFGSETSCAGHWRRWCIIGGGGGGGEESLFFH